MATTRLGINFPKRATGICHKAATAFPSRLSSNKSGTRLVPCTYADVEKCFFAANFELNLQLRAYNITTAFCDSLKFKGEIMNTCTYATFRRNKLSLHYNLFLQ